MTALPETTAITLDNGGDGTFHMTLGEFFAANADSLGAEDHEDIANTLADGRTYHGGGGAEAEWSVRLAPTKPEATIEQRLHAAGLGHRRDAHSRNDDRHTVFVIGTGEVLGRYLAHDALALTQPRGEHIAKAEG